MLSPAEFAALDRATGVAVGLVRGLGMPVPVACLHVGRRYAVNEHEVFRRLTLAGVRVSAMWMTGCRRRPTRRPTRARDECEGAVKPIRRTA